MTQKTNLNVSPYYDDFDSEKNYHKVLYKPGFPVQARELTSSQSILQNQIESFGSNIFKEGSPVNAGEIAYVNQFSAVKVNTINFGIDVSIYLNNFIGKKIIGDTSGINATVKYVAYPTTDDVDDITIYVTYTSSDTTNSISPFYDGETLSCSENVVYGNTTIDAGTPFVSLISSGATATGSAAYISKGIYYIRGYFVNVSEQTLVLDYYTNVPSYRVGLKISETILNAKNDNSLYDNAKGFTNYAAPGADRLKFNLSLSKKLLTDNDDTDFVELMRIHKGKIKKIITSSQYDEIRDFMADRTYDESGHYAVNPFTPSLHNSLDDKLGNNGLFYPTEKTEKNNTPSDDLMCVKISPGRSYVRGYDVDKVGTTILDVEKPREVGINSAAGVNFNMGNILRINTVSGVPKQGDIVTLYDSFIGSDPAGIGSARVYGINLEDNQYTGDGSVWDLRLFDIQTNTVLTLNKDATSTEIPESSYIKGMSSGASGYVVENESSSTEFHLNQTSGSFSKGEQIEVNGVPFSATIGVVTAYNTQNIKSVSSTATGYPNFTANSNLEKFPMPGGISIVDITGVSDGVSTATAGFKPFTGIRRGSVVRYQKAGFSTETYNKVDSISDDGYSLILKAIGNNVNGVYNGELPTADTQVTMFAGGPIIKGNDSLYVPLSNSNVSDLDLVNSELRVTKQITGESTSASGKLTTMMSDVQSLYPEIQNATFESFDQEKYSIHYSDGTVGAIKNDSFIYQNNGDQFSITSLKNNETNVIVNSTINKRGIVSKMKEYNRSMTLDVVYSKYEKSGSVAVGNGAQQIADGLIYDTNQRYGLRVQDEEISLNYPDVVKVLAVYESLDTAAPVLDIVEFTSTVNVTNNAVIGEKITSSNNNAVAQVVTKPEANKLGIVYLTLDKFSAADFVFFNESNIQTNIETITVGKYSNITNKFILDKGQRDEYYDYSRLVRNSDVSEPSKRLLVVFDYYSVPSSDNGDVFSVLSYGEGRFSNDIPSIGIDAIRASDTIDFRPMVSPYDVNASSKSPFDFDSRVLPIKQYATPNEITRVGYEYYLPRIDKLALNKFGAFVYSKGVSSDNPKPPVVNSDLMEIATIKLPPYLYHPQDARMVLVDNKRYTMRDIGYIDDRVANLEEVTSLTMLELNTQSLQIQDAEGKTRFKTGFFVDGFTDYSGMNRPLSGVEINPFANEITPSVNRDTLALQLAPDKSIISSELDFRENFDLLDANVQKTGNAVTLKYDEVKWIEQIYATKDSEVNVNPYELPTYTGSLQLDPESDTWTNTIQLEDKNIRQSGNNNIHNAQLDLSLNGNLDLVGERETENSRHIRTRNRRIRASVTETSTTDTTSGSLSMFDSASTSLSLSNIDTFSQNNLISSGMDDFMRSRNTEFRSTGFPDYTKSYLFVDGEKVDFIPKMLEIKKSLESEDYGSDGDFKIGEEVHGVDTDGNVIIKFRLCSPAHKSGPYNNPTEVYPYDPYSSGNNLIPSGYTQSSRTLNVDTRALAEEAQGAYFGYLNKNTKLIGQESGSEAYVKDLRLISDGFGDIIGSFYLRDPYSIPAPPIRINTGSKTVRITTSNVNDQSEPGASSDVVFAESRYAANGSTTVWQNEITEVTNTDTINLSASASANINASSTHTINHTETVTVEYIDPVAQTFVVGGSVDSPSAVNQANEDYNGAFITSVGIFFHSIDDVAESPITCQIRSTTGDARPSRTILGRSVTLRPTRVNPDGSTTNLIEFDSESASKETKFTFPEPIWLEPGRSYAVVLIAPKSVKYKVWTAIHGKNAVNVQSIPGAGSGASLQYTTQFGTGALFKSQNGALWTEDQTQDLTFRLYKAKFTATSGAATFYNPDLNESNGYIRKLNNNSIRTFQKVGSIGITTISNTDAGETDLATLVSVLAPGRKICGGFNSSTAVISGVGCSVTGVEKVFGGSNYIADTEVDTFAITGNGTGLKLNVGVDGSGAISTVDLIVGQEGNGYKVGDVVGIKTATVGTDGGQGTGAEISITTIGGIDTLYLENIQGDNNAFPGDDSVALKYFNNSNVITTVSNKTIRTNDINESGVNKGNYFKVDHYNHGMYSSTNKVNIYDVKSDVPPTVLTADLSKNESNTINIDDVSVFSTFEGLSVGAANTGYVKIGTEIIGYETVTAAGGGSGGTLTIANSPNGRGVDGTIDVNHEKGSKVLKYEVSKVSLRRINTEHSISNLYKNLDDYYIQFDRTLNGTNRNADVNLIPQLSFSDDKFLGGDNIKASENIVYNAIVPRFDYLEPSGLDGGTTKVDARIRTTSGTSVGGNENSFNDNGFKTVQLNNYNPYNDVQIVASKVNENTYLNNLPRNKSLTAVLTMTSTNENLSPIVFVRGSSAIEFINHRLNNPINSENYSSDSRVNSILHDPHSAVYISRLVTLTKPATSLKVLFSAYRHFSSDFRVLYSLIRVDSSGVEQTFELFPGYKNLNDIDDDGFGDVIINPSNNDGRSDSFVSASANNEYREYQYTADNLDLFTGYVIKIVMSGTNQAEFPRIKEFRSIAVR